MRLRGVGFFSPAGGRVAAKSREEVTLLLMLGQVSSDGRRSYVEGQEEGLRTSRIFVPFVDHPNLFEAKSASSALGTCCRPQRVLFSHHCPPRPPVRCTIHRGKSPSSPRRHEPRFIPACHRFAPCFSPSFSPPSSSFPVARRPTAPNSPGSSAGERWRSARTPTRGRLSARTKLHGSRERVLRKELRHGGRFFSGGRLTVQHRSQHLLAFPLLADHPF